MSLAAESLRFGKAVDSEIFQIVTITRDTIIQKTQKQNNSFEIITPLMACRGHSLVLHAASAHELTEWVDSISKVIERLGHLPVYVDSVPHSPLLAPPSRRPPVPVSLEKERKSL